MKKLVIITFLLLIRITDGFCSQVNTKVDSLLKVPGSSLWENMSDSAKADVYRRLSIELMRKSPEKVIEYAGKYLFLARKTENLQDEAIALNLLGGAYKNTGDYEKALDFYKQSLQIRKKLNDNVLIANSFNNIGIVFCKKGLPGKGVPYFKKALAIRFAEQDTVGIAQSLNNIGVVYKILGNYDSAFVYLERSLEIKRRIGDKELIASSLTSLGELCAIKGRSDESFDYFGEALKLRKEIEDKLGTVISSISLARLTNEKGDPIQALQYLQSALVTVFDGFTGTSFLSNPEPEIVFDFNIIKLLDLKADILKQVYETDTSQISFLKAALDTYELILKLSDNIRKFYTYENSKLFLTGNTRKYHEKAIKTALELFVITGENKYKTLAFTFAEKSKAGLLSDQIREHEAKVFAGIPDSLLAQEKYLKENIAELRRKLYSGKHKHDRTWVEKTGKRLFDLKLQLDNLVKNIEKKNPSYFKLKFSNKIFSVSEIQNLLDSRDLILEYFLTDDFLFTFIISNSDFSLVKIPVDTLFINEVSRFYRLVSHIDENGKSAVPVEDFVASSYYLYRRLIAPVRSRFDQKSLIIIPDGILSYIPFDILITHLDENMSGYRNLPYLLRNTCTSYDYSASLYCRAMKTSSPGKCKGLAAYALSFKKTDYTYDKKQIERIRNRDEELAELIGVIKEVEDISSIIPAEVYTDSVATECKFRETASGHCIIHLATHGIIDGENPMYSRLVFEKNDSCDEDGNLFTYELFNMRLNAGMAVLSACKTGYGKLEKGEGVMTVARGFLYSGVPSLVISLWNVNDYSTGILMKYFYGYLKKGKPKNEALRLAKLDFLQNADEMVTNPFFWAEFIHIGNTKPLPVNRNFFPAVISFIAVILILLFVVTAAVKKNKKRRNNRRYKEYS